MAPLFLSGALLSHEETEQGVYQITQLEEEIALPKPVEGRTDVREEIDWSFGPVRIKGYVDTSTYEIGVEVSVLGIKLGSFYGNLKDGLVINIDLFLAKGSIKFYLKNGNELWVRVDLDVKFDGSFHQDAKILSW